MFIIKKNYYIYINNTKIINLDLIKKGSKIIIIYRNLVYKEKIKQLINFKKKCKLKKIKFFIANNIKLAKKCNADGLYLSAHNSKKVYKNFQLIGSAHNYKEIYKKINQGCKTIILSRLFKTNYPNKKSFLGTTKFNLIDQKYKLNLVPLGGINYLNLLKLNMINSSSFAISSAAKKKPAIFSRLF